MKKKLKKIKDTVRTASTFMFGIGMKIAIVSLALNVVTTDSRGGSK